MRLVAATIVALASLTLAACGGFEGINASTEAIEEIHRRLDSGEHEAIWNAAHPDMRESKSKDEVLALLASVTSKLGKVESSRTTGTNLNKQVSVTTVTVERNTTFENGSGDETFRFLIEDGKALLTGYEISSKVLDGK